MLIASFGIYLRDRAGSEFSNPMPDILSLSKKPIATRHPAKIGSKIWEGYDHLAKGERHHQTLLYGLQKLLASQDHSISNIVISFFQKSEFAKLNDS